MPGEGTFDALGFDSSGFDGGTEALEEAWDGKEDGGTKELDVVGKTENVTVEETDCRTCPESYVLTETTVDVRERQVRQHYVFILHMDNTSVATTCCCDGVGVGEDHPLGGTGRTGCVVDGDGIFWLWNDELAGVGSSKSLN